MTLKEILEEKGITTYRLYKESGLVMSACYRLVNDERSINNATITTVQKLANVLTKGNVNTLLQLLNDDNRIKE